jgi:hypothetical protein
MEITMDIKSTIRGTRTTLANRRTERIARRRLAAELAAFSSPTERAELESVLERHSPADADEVRAILVRQDMARQMAGRRY